MWSKIVSFIFDKDNQRFMLFVGLVLSVFLTLSQCNKKNEYKAEIQQQKNNIEALQDTVGHYKNRAGELTAEKLALQTDKEQLKQVNEDLYGELEKERDRVEQITQVDAEIEGDSTDADSTGTSHLGNRDWRFDWNLSREGEEWKRVLTGYTEFTVDSTGVPYDPNTRITTDLLHLQFTTGVTSNNGQKRIFVRSSYPNLRVTDINGAVIEEPEQVSNPSRFGIGPVIGAGYTPKGFQPYVGISLNYNLIRF